MKDIVARGGFIPKLRRFRRFTDHYRLIPLNPSRWILVLMSQPDCIDKLMGRRAPIEKTKIHRRFIQRDIPATSSHVGADSVVLIEGDADFCIRCVAEFKREIGHWSSAYSVPNQACYLSPTFFNWSALSISIPME